MAFEATKREWCELYTFFRLLTEGKVTLGTAKAKKGEIDWPIAEIRSPGRFWDCGRFDFAGCQVLFGG